jgi:AraC-like DNA-binding protein
MSTAIVVLRLLAVSQLLLSAGALAASRDPVPIRVAGVALAMGTICYLVFPLIGADAQRGVAAGAAMLAQAIPLLLFAFVWQVFEDEQRLPMALWPAAAAFLVLVAMLEFDRDARVAAAATSLAILVQVAKLAFALAAMLVVWKGRENDLDEARLRLRRVFAAGTAGVVAAVVTTELVARWRVPQLVEALGMALIFVLVYTINLALLRRNRSFTLVDLRAPTATPAAPSPVLEALTRLMCEQRLYAEPDLRIAGLAARLKIPEYQLRRTINGLLGYRNFNQFVNRYRIEEAAQRLLAEPRTPVLTIALDVGFRSLSSFNAAFRAHYERSPTEYRASAPTNF